MRDVAKIELESLVFKPSIPALAADAFSLWAAWKPVSSEFRGLSPISRTPDRVRGAGICVKILKLST